VLTLDEAIIECAIMVENAIGRDLIEPERSTLVDAINRWVKQRAVKAALH